MQSSGGCKIEKPAMQDTHARSATQDEHARSATPDTHARSATPDTHARSATPGVLARATLWFGGAALFLAAATDFASVVGRHIGVNLFGSTEIVQLLIVGIVSAALVSATLHGTHAAVHLLAARLNPRLKRLQHRLSEAVTVCVLLAMLAGSAYVFVLLLPLDERSDLLGLPIAPARCVWCVALIVSAAHSTRQAWRR